MSNLEPTTELLRLRDVLTWLPSVTLRQLQQLESTGLIDPLRLGKGSRAFYHKTELKRVFRV